MRLVTLHRSIGAAGTAEAVAWLREIARRTKRNPGTALDAVVVDSKADAAYAYANHGRWVADCPSDDCNAAMLAEIGEPFMCGECFNDEIGGRWRRVVWPDDAERIDAELAKRPRTVNRNCSRDESLEHIRRENKLHGVK